MAYFRCTFANGGAELTVQCDSELAGNTISCSNGVKTYQAVCPSSSPYEVKFRISEEGTWTVSTEVLGATVSDTVAIVLEYSAELNSGFIWKTWAVAGGISESKYNTLADLLADEPDVRMLMTKHASVDYLAGTIVVNNDLETVINDNYVAKWTSLRDYAMDKMEANAEIKSAMDTAGKYGYGEWGIIDNTTTPATWGPKGNVPVMTSNSAPYGEAINYNCPAALTSTAYKAFDGSSSTYAETGQSTGSPAFGIGYHFTNPVCVKKVYYHSRPNMQTQTAYVQASNDNSTWTDLAEFTITADSDHNISISNNTTYYLYYHIIGTQYNNGGAVSLQFYGRELKVSVPTMTSNTAPYGSVSASSKYSTNFNEYQAFDMSNANGWLGALGQSNC